MPNSSGQEANFSIENLLYSFTYLHRKPDELGHLAGFVFNKHQSTIINPNPDLKLEPKMGIVFIGTVLDNKEATDGLKVYEKIKDANPKQSILFVSGSLNGEIIDKMQKLGVSSYIEKPYAIKDICIAIRRNLSNSNLL